MVDSLAWDDAKLEANHAAWIAWWYPIIQDIPMADLWIGRKVLEAQGPLDVDNIIARWDQGEWADLMVLEELLTALRDWKRYVNDPEDAMKLIIYFSKQIALNSNPQTVISLLYVVGEYISNTEWYNFNSGDHDDVKTTYANQALLTENTHQVLEDWNTYTQPEGYQSIELLHANKLRTQINTFLVAVPVAEKARVQAVGKILWEILWIDTTKQTDWRKIIPQAQKYTWRQS